MAADLCISIRYIQPHPLYHGRRDAGAPEWPPSPMRVFQALVNAACLRGRSRELPNEVRESLLELETARPTIVAPAATTSAVRYRIFVPHNQFDLVAAARKRGGGEWSSAFRKLVGSCRAEKDVLAMSIAAPGQDLPTVHYLYPLGQSTLDPQELLDILRPSVRAITHLGWGIDQVVADAALIDPWDAGLVGERWSPSAGRGIQLRVHRSGTLEELTRRYDEFLSRLRNGTWQPVAPLSAVDHVYYRRDSDPIGRPYVVFKLLDSNDDTYTHPHARLVHLAGMVRHLAIDAMTKNPPRSVREPATWVERYVAGHREKTTGAADRAHAQLSYVPLPSVGHTHTDPGVRRVMIVAPVGDDELLEHLARQLDMRQLRPERPEHLRGPVYLARVRSDDVIDTYSGASSNWASFTPVILPGHDDRKAEKAEKLIRKALWQSGIDQPCDFEWSPFSHFAKSYSAHKYVRDEHAKGGVRPAGYIRPDHLLQQTAVHLRLTFQQPIPGPLTIGAGRHCGFGLMAAINAARASSQDDVSS